ncbi:MAG TPA: hypothetical protein VMS93_08445 [Candidatus Saccharimonadales bacterium]|nr:hypothetical protein [Candidatus Saccharimonadales bacterium]
MEAPRALAESWPAVARLSLAAIGVTLLAFAAARRAELMFERVCDLNRDRLDLLERGLQATPLRSRLEALALRLEHAAPAATGAARLLTAVLLVQWAVCAAAAVAGFSRAPALSDPWPWLDAAWLAALAGIGAWLGRQVHHAARAAEESTAHARRYEFLFVSSMRRKSEP